MLSLNLQASPICCARCLKLPTRQMPENLINASFPNSSPRNQTPALLENAAVLISSDPQKGCIALQASPASTRACHTAPHQPPVPPPHHTPQTPQVHKHAAYSRRRVPKPCVAGCQHPLEQKPLQCCAGKARIGSGCANSRLGAQNPSFAATVSAVYNRLNCFEASTLLVYAP